VESGVGAVPEQEAQVPVAALVLDVAHLVINRDEVLGVDPAERRDRCYKIIFSGQLYFLMNLC
jgi:hypothetical protein